MTEKVPRPPLELGVVVFVEKSGRVMLNEDRPSGNSPGSVVCARKTGLGGILLTARDRRYREAAVIF